jgi:hypothetical protein
MPASCQARNLIGSLSAAVPCCYNVVLIMPLFLCTQAAKLMGLLSSF